MAAKAAGGEAEDFVAGREVVDAIAAFFDHARDFETQVLCKVSREDQPFRKSSRELEHVLEVERRGMNADQHFSGSGFGERSFGDFEAAVLAGPSAQFEWAERRPGGCVAEPAH